MKSIGRCVECGKSGSTRGFDLRVYGFPMAAYEHRLKYRGSYGASRLVQVGEATWARLLCKGCRDGQVSKG